MAVASKYQSPEFISKTGIHSVCPEARRAAYANREDITGTIKTNGFTRIEEEVYRVAGRACPSGDADPCL